jgi:hypothetical protein
MKTAAATELNISRTHNRTVADQFLVTIRAVLPISFEKSTGLTSYRLILRSVPEVRLMVHCSPALDNCLRNTERTKLCNERANNALPRHPRTRFPAGGRKQSPVGAQGFAQELAQGFAR